MNNKNQKENTKQKPIIFIVDDNEEVAKSLHWLVETFGYRVESYPSANAFLENYQAGQVGILLLDVRMPEISGLKLQEMMIEREIELPIIFITGHGDIPMTVRAMKGGAVEFLTKPINNQILLEAINNAIKLAEEKQHTSDILHEINLRVKILTPREHQIMRLVASGKSTKMIAYELGISANTVDIHRSNIMKKMKVKTVSELVRLVVSYNL